jgi:hypothetical protein
MHLGIGALSASSLLQKQTERRFEHLAVRKKAASALISGQGLGAKDWMRLESEVTVGVIDVLGVIPAEPSVDPTTVQQVPGSNKAC